MKLLLIRSDTNYIFGAVDPPLGILSLSASVKKQFGAEVEVRVRDMRLRGQNEESLSEEVVTWEPDVVGLSALSPEADRTAHLARFVKRLRPQADILVGGPYGTTMPLECLERTGADVVFRGEGERSLCDWLRRRLDGRCAEDVPGLVLPRKHGQPLLTAPPEIINDLDALPMPDWGAIPLRDYHFGSSMNWINAHPRYTSIMTSRGCPFQCVYCHHMFGREMRFRSLERVMEEIDELYHAHAIREFQIVDDIFNIRRERVLEFCRMIRASDMRPYFCFPNGVRGDLLDEEVIDELKDAGTYMITFAIESASSRIQALIKKKLNLSRVGEMIRYADRRGLITKAYAMIGFVTETREEIEETIRLILSMPLLQVSFFTVVPQKNTELYEMTKKIHGQFQLADGAQYWGHSPRYEQQSTYDLLRLQRWAYIRFYFCSTRLLRMLWRFPRPFHFLKEFFLHGIEGLFRIRQRALGSPGSFGSCHLRKGRIRLRALSSSICPVGHVRRPSGQNGREAVGDGAGAGRHQDGTGRRPSGHS